MAIGKSNNDTVVFPSVPQQDIEFETFNLYFRQQKEQIYIEAIGPHGERVEVPTDLSKLDRNASSEQFGKALMPESVRKIYLNLLEGTSKKNKGLRIQLDFTGATSIYASLPWEKASLDGKTIITSPKQTITRTVASPIPALPFEASQKPYRILLVLSNPDFVMIEGKKKKLPRFKLNEDYEKIKEAVQPLVEQDMLEIILLESWSGKLLHT